MIILQSSLETGQMRKLKRINGRAEAARERVLKAAIRRRKNGITNEQAKAIGGWNHAYHHLMLLCQAGLLEHAEHNRWMATSLAKTRDAANG